MEEFIKRDETYRLRSTVESLRAENDMIYKALNEHAEAIREMRAQIVAMAKALALPRVV